MNAILRRLFILTASTAISLLVLTVISRAYLDGWLRAKLEEVAGQKLGAPVQIGSLKTRWLPPQTIDINEISLSLPEPNCQVAINQAAISLQPHLAILTGGGAMLTAQMRVVHPVIHCRLPETTPQAAQPSEPTTTVIAVPQLPAGRDLAITLSVEEGRVEVERGDQKAFLQDLNLSVNLPSTQNLNASFAQSGRLILEQSNLKLALPIKFSTGVNLVEDRLTLNEASGDIAGIKFTLSAESHLSKKLQKFQLNVDVPEIAQLPIPPTFLPPGQWSGRLQADIKGSVVSGQPDIQGHLRLQNFSGQTQWRQEDLRAQGRLRAEAQVEFYLAKDWSLPRVILRADLDELEVEKTGVFKKPSGIPLRLALDAAGNSSLVRITQARAQFANLVAQIAGSVGGLDAKSGASTATDIHVEVARTALNGWEKYFAALAQSPVQGEVQISAQITGSWKEPEKLKLALNPLNLRGLRAVVHLQQPDRQISGPIAVDLAAQIEAIGNKLQTARVNGNLQARDMSIVLPGILAKPKGKELGFQIQAGQNDDTVQLQEAKLSLPGGSLRLTGKIKGLQNPSLELQLSTSALVVQEIASLSPLSKPYDLRGEMQTQLGISGIYDASKGVQGSNLQARGNIRLKLARLLLPDPPKPSADKKGATPPASPAQSLAPDWPIVRNSDLHFDINIGQVVYNGLNIEGLVAKPNLSKGVLTAQASVRKVFAGEAQVSQLSVPLLQPLPIVQIAAQVKHLDLAQAVNWATPEWKDLLKGIATMSIQATLPSPQTADFKSKLVSQGDFLVQDAFLSTMQLDQMVNQALAKIPGVGDQGQLKSGGVAAEMRGKFSVRNAELDLRDFRFLTPERNQLDANGKIGFDKNIDLAGTAFLAQAPVGGSVRAANSDASGRLVLPVKIRGNLLKPEASFAQETLTEIVRKTAAYEGQKLQKQATDKAKEQGKKLLDNKLEDLKKNGLKGLFGK